MSPFRDPARTPVGLVRPRQRRDDDRRTARTPTLILAVLVARRASPTRCSAPRSSRRCRRSSTTCTRPRPAITWLLTAYLLVRLGRHGDPRPPRRHVRQGAPAAVDARDPRRRHAARRRVELAGACSIVARFIQGAAGGIFPLAFGIVRDEFPREKVAGSIGLLSAILGVGAGVGIVLVGRDRRAPQLPLAVLDPARRDRRRGGRDVALHPRVAGARPGPRQLAGRGADDARHLHRAARDQRDDDVGLGLAEDARPARWSASPSRRAWIAVEVRSDNPLIDMTMMRIRGVWTTNLAAFLLGAGMYASFIVFPQFAQLPKSTGLRLRRLGRRLRPVPAARRRSA